MKFSKKNYKLIIGIIIQGILISGISVYATFSSQSVSLNSALTNYTHILEN